MSNRQMAMPARYYHKGLTGAFSTEGVLRMTQERLVFRPYDPTACGCAEVNECFNQIERIERYISDEGGIKQLKLTVKKGQIFWFAFDTSNEREVCLNFAEIVLAMQSSVQDTKVSETPASTIHDMQQIAEEKERPHNLLHDDYNELLKQHKQFVTDGMLTEAEDRATKKTLKFRIRLPPEIVHQVSGMHLDEIQGEGIVDDTKDAITTISTSKSAERTKEENFDADEWELLEAKNEHEENVF